MNSIKWILFAAAILLELLYIALFIITVKVPNFKFWPPPSARSWQFFSAWIIASLVAVFFLFLGLLDFDSAILHHWIRFPISLVLFVMSSIVGTWAYSSLGLWATLGLGKRLITKGPYRYTRNPQYLADMLNIFVYMLFTNSWMVWLTGVLGVSLNLLAPFTEEPWLEEQFGVEYMEYKSRVPRFL